MGFIKAEDNEELHQKLVKRIMEEGCYGLKAYFCATLAGQTQAQEVGQKIDIKINTARVLPVEAW